MEQPCETSTSTPTQPPNPTAKKPVFVRVKRKSNQERLDAFWLEISERPAKKQLLDLQSLSISESPLKVIEESRTKKLLVQHVETISHSEAAKDVLHSFLPDSDDSKDFKSKFEERRRMTKQDKKPEQLRSAARQNHEALVRSARFEQIWKSRRGRMETDDDSLREICHLYDVVRVDGDDKGNTKKAEEPNDIPVEDNTILCNYLPLLRELLPLAAEEIESDMMSYKFKEDNYVYDLYAVEEGVEENKEATSTEYPLVQVNYDDDYYDGPCCSDYETDDSNAEDNPLNDYPDEESSEDEEEILDPESQYEDEIVNSAEEDDSADEDGKDWRWEYR